MKGCLATFLAIIAGILTLLVLVAAGARFTLFDLQFLKAQLIKNDIYGYIANDLVPSLLSEGIGQINQCGVEGTTEDAATCEATQTNQSSDSDMPEGTIPLTEEDLSNIVSEVITEESLQTTVETAINEFDAYLKDKTNEPEIVIDISSYRTTLIDSSIALLEDKYNELPVCTSTQLHEQSTSTTQDFPECRPSGVNFEDYAYASTGGQDLKTVITDGLSKTIPNQIDVLRPEIWQANEDTTPEQLLTLEAQGQNIRDTLSQVRNVYSKITSGIFIAIAVDTALLLLLLVLYITNLRSGFRWVGIPLVISAGLTFVVALSGNLLVTRGITTLMQQNTSGAGATTDDALNSLVTLVTSIFGSVFARIGLYAGIVLGAGVLLIILSFVFKKKGSATTVAPQPGAIQPAPTPMAAPETTVAVAVPPQPRAVQSTQVASAPQSAPPPPVAQVRTAPVTTAVSPPTTTSAPTTVVQQTGSIQPAPTATKIHTATTTVK